MPWNTDWLSALDSLQLEDLYSECRSLIRRHRQAGNFAMAQWWTNLTADVTAEALQRYRDELPMENQLTLPFDELAPRRQAREAAGQPPEGPQVVPDDDQCWLQTVDADPYWDPGA